MKNRILVGSVIAGVVLLAAGAAAIAGPLSSGSASALPSTCGPLFYKGSGKPQFIVVSDLPAAGRGSRAEPAHGAGDPVRAAGPVQVQGRQVHRRLSGVRRLDGTGGSLRHGHVLVERTSLREYVERDRGARDVQLGVLEARAADPEPGPGRQCRHGQLGEHRRRPDALRTVERPRRAGHLLPDEASELRPRRGVRRLPGPVDGRRVQGAPQREEHLHPPGQHDVR